jgi:putative spermidine/putrescine transport system ATP-binding protein
MDSGARMRGNPAGAGLALRGIRKAFGPVVALDGIDLKVKSGEFLTILGPSGSGKTTLLKIVAGFELPEEGCVLLGGADMTFTAPARRNVGMVFQNYALFPHMDVRGNIAFPLEVRRLRRAEIDRRVATTLALVDLEGYRSRFPRQLSGGQQQRVALARAIVFGPQLLLLDEPFGALDRKLREAMQLEVRRLARHLGLTTVFITHDQEEALILSDRIAVMNRGRIEQVALPRELYERPANAFVADFVGESNLLFGRIAAARDGHAEIEFENGLRLTARADMPVGTRVGALIRPERLHLAGARAQSENRLCGEVIETIYLGTSHKYRLRLTNGTEILVRVSDSAGEASAEIGARLRFDAAPADVHVFRHE